ncbi:MAG: hypothetical protein JWP08_388 [Bryobacterales bacterium]|nr:hypothetical protein [Bryobacterales bacterium]
MATAPTPFRVWKTIKLGTCHKTADDFRTALEAAGCWIADGANDILGSAGFQAADQETEITLIIRSVADLGFTSALAPVNSASNSARQKSARSFGGAPSRYPLQLS